jgi:hypothetical protein
VAHPLAASECALHGIICIQGEQNALLLSSDALQLCVSDAESCALRKSRDANEAQ